MLEEHVFYSINITSTVPLNINSVPLSVNLSCFSHMTVLRRLASIPYTKYSHCRRNVLLMSIKIHILILYLCDIDMCVSCTRCIKYFVFTYTLAGWLETTRILCRWTWPCVVASVWMVLYLYSQIAGSRYSLV